MRVCALNHGFIIVLDRQPEMTRLLAWPESDNGQHPRAASTATICVKNYVRNRRAEQ